ncbi:MAG: hypothetical protein OEY43_05150 [Gammaproteobacteria bacterium]|nr:hypothetical protein [Gammaproteobacteria bacterium]
MNQLHQLVEEILDFSTAIDHNQDTDHVDYQRACHLFCDYIENRINQLSHLPDAQKLFNEEENRALHKLSRPDEYITRPSSHWLNRLFEHCNQLQKKHHSSLDH